MIGGGGCDRHGGTRAFLPYIALGDSAFSRHESMQIHI